MNARSVIEEAIERLHELDEDPRSGLLRRLEALLEPGVELPDGEEVLLVATIQPGGVYSVTDQHGRPLRNVHSVAVFKDQTGRDVMQINL